ALRVPGLPSGAIFQVRGGLGTPFVGPDLAPTQGAVDALVAGTVKDLQRLYGTTVSAAILPQVSSYVRDQLTALATSGRAALVAGFGTSPVHSISTLSEDAGFLTLMLVGGITPPPGPPGPGPDPGPDPGDGSGDGNDDDDDDDDQCTVTVPAGGSCPAD